MSNMYSKSSKFAISYYQIAVQNGLVCNQIKRPGDYACHDFNLWKIEFVRYTTIPRALVKTTE